MNHYEILGVNKNATQDEIKKQFRKLAQTHHPDKGGDVKKFQEISEAYEVLSDPSKRSQYDSPRTHQQHTGFGNGFNQHQHDFGFNVNGSHVNLNDIFSQMFGQQHHHSFHPGANRQQQLFRTRINVSLEEAYSGGEKTLQLNTPNGLKVITIKIPAGIASSGQIRYDNVLDNGVLIVEFEILSDLRFDRKQNDLYSDLSISVLELIVGTSMHFTTINGEKLNININPMTQPNMQLRLPGKGMPIINTNNFGDQILIIKPYIPNNVSAELIEAIHNNINSQQKQKAN